MAEIWFVVHHANLWDIDNRIIGFWKKNQSDLIKTGDYVIYYRTGYKEIMGVFKVIQKGYLINKEFNDPEIVEEPAYQSKLELVSDSVICDRATIETRFSFFDEWRRNRYGGLGKQVFKASKDDLNLLLADPSVLK